MRPFAYLRKQIRSFGYAFNGLRLTLLDHNAWVHGPATLLVVGAGAFFGVSRWEWLWLAAAIFGIWAAETFNTAIEKLVDLVQPEPHPLAGQVKDLAAGAVLIMLGFAVTVGALVLGPYLLRWLGIG